MIISSQRHLQDEKVKEKIENEDYNVVISPEFKINSEIYQVVLDGHHSLQAAKIAGVKPRFVIATSSDDDNVGILKYDNDPQRFIETIQMDSDYYNIETGIDVW